MDDETNLGANELTYVVTVISRWLAKRHQP